MYPKFATFILIVLGIVFTQCKKDNNHPADIPDVVVDKYLYLNEPENFSIQAIGGWKYEAGGVRGMIVYRTVNGFNVYERNTPYESAKSCAIVDVDSSALFAVDQCSGSKFLLLDGSVSSGPATFPLKQYRTQLTGGVLRIFN